MDKVKITLDEWTELGQYNYAAKWVRRFCRYDLIKESDFTFKREQRIGLVAYLIMFIPAHIIQAFWCMWDGGLREFEFAERYLGGDWITAGELAFERAEKIWNSKVNK
jgi:hypothetical protein